MLWKPYFNFLLTDLYEFRCVFYRKFKSSTLRFIIKKYLIYIHYHRFEIRIAITFIHLFF